MPVPSSWQPKELLEQIAREPLGIMRKGVGSAPFLIVRLDDFSNDLRNGLAAADELADRQRMNRAIKSTLQISVDMIEQLRGARGQTQEVSLPLTAAETSRSARSGFPVAEWLSARCYVVRLSNRSEGGPLVLGRDPTHHIVLQHPSVSATHAQLTVGPELVLRDAKSRNGTLVNGVPIKGSVPLNVGDKIKLGAVQTVLCSSEDVWHAVR